MQNAPISRRNFVKSTATGLAAADMFTATSGFAAAAEASDVEWDGECDVLVIGAGGAGLVTAISANREGASVILIDSQGSSYSSSTALCKGHFCVVGSPEQEAMGVEDTPDICVADIEATGGSSMGACPSERALHNLDLTRKFAENSAAGEQFLKDLGFEFPEPYMTSGSTVPRTYVIDNMHMVEFLVGAAGDEGVTMEYETTFQRLVLDATGRVLGAIATDADGNEKRIKGGKATVLATGSFVRNTELVEKCMPSLSKVVNMCGIGDTGLGHVAAMSLGAPMWGRALLHPTEGYGLEYDPLTSFIVNTDFQFCNMYDEPLGGGTLYGIGEIMLRSQEGNEYMVGSSISSNNAFGLLLGKQVAALPDWE